MQQGYIVADARAADRRVAFPMRGTESSLRLLIGLADCEDSQLQLTQMRIWSGSGSFRPALRKIEIFKCSAFALPGHRRKVQRRCRAIKAPPCGLDRLDAIAASSAGRPDMAQAGCAGILNFPPLPAPPFPHPKDSQTRREVPASDSLLPQGPRCLSL